MKKNKPEKFTEDKIFALKLATVAYLEYLYPQLPPELKKDLMIPGVLNPVSKPKRTFILEPDMDVNKAYYLHKGMAILYTVSGKKQKKKIFYIWKENEIIVLIKYFREHLKNKQFYIQLIEHAELVSINNVCMDGIYQEHIAAHELTRRISDLKTERRMHQLDIMMEDMKERYELFTELFPDIYHRLTGEQICAYISVSMTTLKTARKKSVK